MFTILAKAVNICPLHKGHITQMVIGCNLGDRRYSSDNVADVFFFKSHITG